MAEAEYPTVIASGVFVQMLQPISDVVLGRGALAGRRGDPRRRRLRDPRIRAGAGRDENFPSIVRRSSGSRRRRWWFCYVRAVDRHRNERRLTEYRYRLQP